MEFSREFYWNLGPAAAPLMYAFVVVTLAIFLYGFARRVRTYRLGKPRPRLDRIPMRLLRALGRGAGQVRLLLVRLPGLTHALLFWGMLLLFAGTLLVLVQVDFTAPLFGLEFLQGSFYLGFSLALDLAGVVVLFMLGGFILRRYILRPKGLESKGDDLLILALLVLILLSGFVVEGARMAVTELGLRPGLAAFSPLGLLAARMLSDLGEGTLLALHRLGWWTHFFLVMTIIALVPFTKFRHLVTTPLNYLFADPDGKGRMTTLDLEEAGVETFGAARVKDLSWKDIFDADACTSCKRCQDRCPAWLTEKPLSPMKVVQQVGEAAFRRPEANLIEAIGPQALWACTTCLACLEICPADIDQVGKILEMRRHLVLMEGTFPGAEVQAAVNNIEVNGNPFGLAFAGRGDWAEGLDVAHLGQGGAVDVLYFAGCHASFDQRNRAVARSFVRLCQAAGLRVGILGKDEKCCGEPVRKMGNEYLYQVLAAENIRRVKESGAGLVVTTCPHCSNTLGSDYRDLGLEVPVEHSSTILHRLLGEGRLPLQPQPFEVTYHDSCQLARGRGILQEPRRLLQQAGGKLREMEKSKLGTFCCGGGGGRILAEENLGRRINLERVRMARATGAPLLVSNCPFCLEMFEDGLKAGSEDGGLQVRDLAEVLADRLPGGTTDRPAAGRN